MNYPGACAGIDDEHRPCLDGEVNRATVHNRTRVAAASSYGFMSTSKDLTSGLSVNVNPLVDGWRYFAGMSRHSGVLGGGPIRGTSILGGVIAT